MRHHLRTVVLLAALCALPASLLSQDVLRSQSLGPKIRVTAGLKGWYGSWNIFGQLSESGATYLAPIYWRDGSGDHTGYLVGEMKSSSAGGMMGGPYVAVAVGPFSATLAYSATLSSFKGDYEAPAGYHSLQEVDGYYTVDAPNSSASMTMKRQDINLTLLYKFIPEFGIFGTLRFFKYTGVSEVSFVGTSASHESSVNYTGFGGGISSTVMFPNSRMYLFGHLGVLSDVSSESGFPSETVVFFDGGVGYQFIAV